MREQELAHPAGGSRPSAAAALRLQAPGADRGRRSAATVTVTLATPPGRFAGQASGS